MDINKVNITFKMFLEEISSLLSDHLVKVDASEEEIKDKICLLMASSKDRQKVISKSKNYTLKI